MRELIVRRELPEAEVGRLAGEFIGDESFDELVAEDTTVRKPNGDVLLKLLKGTIPEQLARQTREALRGAASGAQRGLAGGKHEETGRARVRRLARDGKLSKTSYPAVENVPSGIVGYFDRYPRMPFCRTTAFTLTRRTRFERALPYVRLANECFAREMPERYRVQRELAEATSADFRILGTAFTTITVNRNWRTAVHQDAGDLPEGFGVMGVVGDDNYGGGYLVFPKYRVAVDVRNGDLLLDDVHEWHGNTRLIGLPGRYERLSLVLYYRKKMIECGTAAEELARAKKLRTPR